MDLSQLTGFITLVMLAAGFIVGSIFTVIVTYDNDQAINQIHLRLESLEDEKSE